MCCRAIKASLRFPPFLSPFLFRGMGTVFGLESVGSAPQFLPYFSVRSDFKAHCSFHSWLWQCDISRRGGRWRRNRNDWVLRSLADLLLCLAYRRPRNRCHDLFRFHEGFWIAETINPLVSIWMTAISKTLGTASSFKMDLSIELVALLSNPRTNGLLWSLPKFSIIPILYSLATFVTCASNLSFSWFNSFFIMSQTSKRFTGPFGGSTDVTCFTVRLSWSMSILSSASSNKLDMSYSPSNVFCPLPVGRASSILGDGGSIALRVRRSESSTGATSCRFDLCVLEAVTKIAASPNFSVSLASIRCKILGRNSNL